MNIQGQSTPQRLALLSPLSGSTIHKVSCPGLLLTSLSGLRSPNYLALPYAHRGCFVPPVTWMCSDDARTRAEGIFEVSIRRDFGYAVSHCVIPFVFDVKFAEMTA